MNQNEKTQLVKITGEYLVFQVPSSRGGTHEVILNRKTQEWSCTCEDYWYRKRACKHVREAKEFLQDLLFEVALTHKAYIGQTLSPAEI